MTLVEASRRYEVSVTSLRARIRDGDLPARRVSSQGRREAAWVIDEEELAARWPLRAMSSDAAHRCLESVVAEVAAELGGLRVAVESLSTQLDELRRQPVVVRLDNNEGHAQPARRGWWARLVSWRRAPRRVPSPSPASVRPRGSGRLRAPSPPGGR